MRAGDALELLRNLDDKVTGLEREISGLVAAVHNETVGQYIGIKDERCNEIYEGDIVKNIDNLFHNNSLVDQYVIKYSVSGFYPVSEYPYSESWSVIGNIFD